jgi:hypothetical protein
MPVRGPHPAYVDFNSAWGYWVKGLIGGNVG